MSIKASAQTQTPSEVRMSDGTFSNIARSIAAGVAALGLSQQAPSEAHGAESPTTPITMRSQSPRATTYNLMQTPLSLEMQSGSLEQVVGQLSYLSGVPIEVLWEGPRFPAGLSRDTELSFAVKNLPLGAALDRLAEKLTAFDGSVTWQVLQDGRLQFGTKETLNRFQERRIYPLEDLLAQHPQFANAPAFDLNGALQQGTEAVVAR